MHTGICDLNFSFGKQFGFSLHYYRILQILMDTMTDRT